MLKRMLFLFLLVPVLALTPPRAAFAGRTLTGHVRAVSATSISVADGEVVTAALDARTAFTKLITRKPWQEDTRLDRRALRVGQYVVVHVRKDSPVADWVQIATDLPLERLVTPPNAATVVSTTPAAELVTSSVNHLALSEHYAREAARDEAEANEHLAMANAYRREPNAAETKRPGALGTSVHCERLAASLQAAAADARALAAEHARIAAIAP